MLWKCENDDVLFSVGAPACPECGGTLYREHGVDNAPLRSTETGELVEAAEPAEGQETPRLVSESGPELANLPKGSRVKAAEKSGEDSGK